MNEARQEVRELVARARSGEVEAFEALYNMHQAGIYTFIRSQVRQAELAADLTQDTFVRAWESLPKLREENAFGGWLHRIALNLIRDEVKSGRARLEVGQRAGSKENESPQTEPPTPARDGPEQLALSRIARREIWEALGTLPVDQRNAVVMHHLEEMSVKEIAAAMKVRPGTIMSRLARAREALREKLRGRVEGQNE